MPAKNLVIIVAAVLFSSACYIKAERNQYSATISEAMAIVNRAYVEDVPERQLFESAMHGMLEGLDPYSSYISPTEFQQFKESLDQKFGGVGIVVELNQQTKRLTVLSPLVGTPAYRAGMRAGDVIMTINGNDTEGMTLRESVVLMRGEPGTVVDLTVIHAGDTEETPFSITRDIIPIESVLGDWRKPDGEWVFRLESHPNIGYIRLTTFGEESVEELTRALKTQEPGQPDMDAFILDLRGNAGGLLTAAVSICDMFITDGKIVGTKGRGGEQKRDFEAASATTISPDIPMVVLVNKYSASASEIVSACLQDHKRAIVVGDRTWGKGSVQNIIPMEGGDSAIKITTASYWRPSGKNIHRDEDATEDDIWGVVPNEGFQVSLTAEEFEKVLRARRDRDVYEPINTESDDEAPAPPTPEESTTEDESAAPAASSDSPESSNDSTDDQNETGDDISAEPAANESDTETAEDAEPFVDPQLQRAIEYLEQQLEGASQTAAAA